MSDDEARRRIVDIFCDALERGEDPDPNDYCEGDVKSLEELAETKAIHLLKSPNVFDVRQYVERFPTLPDELRSQLVAKILGYLGHLTQPAPGPCDGRPGAGLHVPGFVLQKCLGRGATGEVWLAYHAKLERIEAIKIASTESWDEATRNRVLEEARAAAQQKHPNLCTVHDVIVYGNGLGIRMQYVDGKTLGEWVEKSQPKPTAQQIAAILAVIARAVHDMHELGRIHRDIKPANIMIPEKGENRPVLVDFGFAKRFDEAALQTQQGSIKGTPEVMAPEQAAGKADVGPATDIYGLGATFYFLHFGRFPFEGKSVEEVLQKIQTEPLSFPGRANKDIRAICARAMAKEPGDRYRTAEALAEDLECFSRTEILPHARPAGLVRQLADTAWKKRRSLLVTALFVSLLAVSCFFALRWWHGHRCRELARQIETLLAADPMPEGGKDQVETRLKELESCDLDAAQEAREKYLDKLLQIWNPAQSRLDAGDLDRIDRVVADLVGGSPVRAAKIRQPFRWERFRQMAAPYTHSTNLYFLVRPDPQRIDNLERVVKIQGWLAPAGEVVGAKFELMRAHFAEGNHSLAQNLAEELLARDSLSAAWRMTILRDYVWLAVQMRDQKGLTEADEHVKKALAGGGKDHLAYRSLLVERARLKATQQLYDQAEQALEEYFALVKKGEFDLRFDEDMPAGLQERDVPRDNVPALFYLDASLLHGFLRAQRGDEDGAQKAWASGFQKTQGTRVGTYYEAAILGSLCEQINVFDVARMVGHTTKGAASQGSSPALRVCSNSLTPLVSGASAYTGSDT